MKLFILIYAATLLTACGMLDRDSSDPPSGRSGMVIHVDELTQCHYLRRNSVLTPRMGADGKQLCGKNVPR